MTLHFRGRLQWLTFLTATLGKRKEITGLSWRRITGQKAKTALSHSISLRPSLLPQWSAAAACCPAADAAVQLITLRRSNRYAVCHDSLKKCSNRIFCRFAGDSGQCAKPFLTDGMSAPSPQAFGPDFRTAFRPSVSELTCMHRAGYGLISTYLFRIVFTACWLALHECLANACEICGEIGHEHDRMRCSARLQHMRSKLYS